MKNAICHSDKKHYSKGLCKSCYNQQNFKAQGRKYKNYHNYEKYKPYYEKNKEKIKAKAIEYYENNKELRKTKVKEYVKHNKATVNSYKAKYRSKKLNATPKWLTKEHIEQIRIFYEASYKLSKELGVRFNVDHIIPLQGKEVCGLHVPWNLQVLEAIINIKKRNKL